MMEKIIKIIGKIKIKYFEMFLSIYKRDLIKKKTNIFLINRKKRNII